MLFATLAETESWQEICDAKTINVVDDTRLALDMSAGHVLVRAALEVPQLEELINSTTTDLVLFYRQPELLIASKIGEGQRDIEQVSELWRLEIQSLIQLQKRNRKRLRLLNLDQCLITPEALVANVGVDLGLPRPSSDLDSEVTLAVCQYFLQQKELQQLKSLLHVISLPVAEDMNWELDVRGILQKLYQQRSELQETQAQVKSERERREILESQIRVKDTEIEKSTLLLQQRGEEHTVEVTSLESKCEDLASESELILEQLHKVQEELEKYHLELSALQDELSHHQKAREKAEIKAINKFKRTRGLLESERYERSIIENELDAIKKSTLWRTSMPVRGLSRLLRASDMAEREQLHANSALILTSEYFDVEWYVKTYADVAESGMNPAEHYLLHGAQEGRNPGPLFDGKAYLDRYPDVAECGNNPLLHYVKHGQSEGRQAALKLLESPVAGD